MGTKKGGRNYWWTLVALLALLVAAPAVFGQSVTTSGIEVAALQRIMEADQHSRALQNAIQTNRAAVVAETAEAWVQTAQERGYGAGWREELVTALNSLCDDKLAEAHDALNYDEMISIVSGRSRRASPPSGLSVSSINVLGDDAQDLVFFPVAPCREINTIVAGGPIPAGGSRNFSVNGNMSGQGGDAGGCGIPVDPAAVVLTITATQEAGAGNLVAYPFSGAVPTTSVLNYRAGVDIANTTIIPVCQICGLDITIKTNGAASTTDVVADITGYFWSPHATPLDVSTVTDAASIAAGANGLVSVSCPAGRTMSGGGCNFASFSSPLEFISSNPLGNGWNCAVQNRGGVADTLTAYARCGRVPGR
jgi:hypothetical protein